MKTRILITSSLIVALIVNLTLPYYSAEAQEASEQSEPEKECEEKKPTFIEIHQEGKKKGEYISLTEIETQINAGEIEWNYGEFTKEFERVQEEYHKYNECIFNFTEKRILGAVGLSKGTMQAQTPNFPNWMKPPAACLEPDELRLIKEDTSSETLLTPLLAMHEKYSNYLDAMVVLYEFKGRENRIGDEELSLTAIDQLSAMAQAYTAIDRITKLEKENALVAMNMAFKALKELRLSFFMHVHFQCMLNNLEKYRRWLENIRIIVDSMPSRLRDCSITK